jgi:hypothetical protein
LHSRCGGSGGIQSQGGDASNRALRAPPDDLQLNSVKLGSIRNTKTVGECVIVQFFEDAAR